MDVCRAFLAKVGELRPGVFVNKSTYTVVSSVVDEVFFARRGLFGEHSPLGGRQRREKNQDGKCGVFHLYELLRYTSRAALMVLWNAWIKPIIDRRAHLAAIWQGQSPSGSPMRAFLYPWLVKPRQIAPLPTVIRPTEGGPRGQSCWQATKIRRRTGRPAKCASFVSILPPSSSLTPRIHRFRATAPQLVPGRVIAGIAITCGGVAAHKTATLRILMV